MANNITHTTRVLELSLALVQRFSHRIEIRKNEKSALNGSFREQLCYNSGDKNREMGNI